MSYNNPNIIVPTTPKGIDKVIESIRLELSELEWLEKSFGRAFLHQEKRDGKAIKLPKVFEGKDYINVLPNDNFKSMSFISVRTPEKWDALNRTGWNMKSRDLSVIFWFNQKEVGQGEYILSELKSQVEAILIGISEIGSINAVFDEKVEDIYNGYTLNDIETQYLMWPYGGLRFDITVKYNDSNCTL